MGRVSEDEHACVSSRWVVGGWRCLPLKNKKSVARGLHKKHVKKAVLRYLRGWKVKTEKTKKKIKTKINIKFRSSAGSNHVRVALVAVPSSSKHLNN